MSLFKTCLFITRGKNIRPLYRNSKLEIIVPTWNGELPDGFYLVADIQDYTEYIIKNIKHNLLILLFILITTGLVFKIKDGYKLELQTPEIMKSFVSRKRLIDKKWQKFTKYWSGWSSFGTKKFSRQSILAKVEGIIYFYTQ